jgi:hypothetical protein
VTRPHGWPQPTDYQDAVQTTAVCFADPYLRAVRIRENGMGLPLAAAGKSAVVFRADSASGDIALRCFTRAASDQQLRYQLLHEHLVLAPPAYMVNFQYRDQAILVNGRRYPVVEMGWVEGDPLDVWVRNHLGQGRDLAEQADAWLAISNDMRARELAHGDLANDNCLVSGTGLKLIDYDGCFIPELADKHPGEAGNPHFQHPGRSGHYSGNMDAFPALVIYLSLLALQGDTSLWNFHTDRNLIFAASDYAAAGQTPIWRALARDADARVVALAEALERMCESPVATLAPLGDVAAQAGIAVRRPAGPGLGPGLSPPWLQEVLGNGHLTGTSRARPAGPAAPSLSWLTDHVRDGRSGAPTAARRGPPPHQPAGPGPAAPPRPGPAGRPRAARPAAPRRATSRRASYQPPPSRPVSARPASGRPARQTSPAVWGAVLVTLLAVLVLVLAIAH